MIPSVGQRTQLDRNLIKRAVKLALDDLKEKHAGVLLSAHALKVFIYPFLTKRLYLQSFNVLLYVAIVLRNYIYKLGVF
jgi:hypothetical protein